MLTSQQRVLRARIAAHALHASHDPRQSTANARAAFLDRFLEEVDPNRELQEAERQRRAAHARSAYFARLAFASSKARSRKNGRREKQFVNGRLVQSEAARS